MNQVIKSRKRRPRGRSTARIIQREKDAALIQNRLDAAKQKVTANGQVTDAVKPRRAPTQPGPAPAKPAALIPTAPVKSGMGRGKLIAIGAGGAALAGGVGYGIHRSRQKKELAMKNLINPFEEVVVFGKAYPVVFPVTNVRSGAALVHTGKHVAHGQKLTHVHNSRGGGGRATKLERYVGKADAPSSGNPSGGRLLTAGAFGGVHPFVAGRKGHKLSAGANSLGEAFAGSTPGNLISMYGSRTRNPKAMAAGSLLSQAGGTAGLLHGVQRNNKAGRYKAQKKNQ